MADNTVYDSVFKTMVHRMPQLLVPFINEAFGHDYPQDSPVICFNSEHETPRGSRIDDSVFRLQEKLYHVECQSTPDSSMVLRMIEYDFDIALEEALKEGEPYELNFPASCVLYLRHTSNTPDALHMMVNLPNGDSFQYETKVIKAQLYSSDEIFSKKLLILLPYYLMRYEKNLPAIAADSALSERLVRECAVLRAELESAVLRMNETSLYEGLIELIIKVSDYLLAAHKALQQEVRKAMGGEVLELWPDKAKRLADEAKAAGREEGVADLSAKLRELGIDEDMLEEAVSSIGAARDKA
ncbi:MAG: hypothetical protein Q4B54_04955 [Coriobacteriales bacterium]|nr:hypothetical protein [Coriobacteriales bacterium]